MKRIVSLVAAVSMVLTFMAPIAVALDDEVPSPFSDVPVGSEFYPYISGLYNQNVIGGLGGYYYPLNNVTRAEMAKMAVNAAGLEVNVCDGAPHFADVPQTHTLYNYVETAYCEGVVQGRGNGMYAPDEPVLRQEAMKIVIGTFRSVDTEGYFTEDLTGAPHFNDVPSTLEFYGDIETAYNLGIVSGYGNGNFGPMDYMRRDQMAKVVYNSWRVSNGETISPEEGYRIKVGVSADEVRNDGSSLVEITGTVEQKVDGNWITDDNYEAPVKFITNLGEFADGDFEYTEVASEGRAHATLRASTEEGTATITVKTGDLPDATAQVSFSSTAPSTKKGFGSSSVSGVGKIELIMTDEDLLIDDIFPGAIGSFYGNFPESRYGNATIEVYVYDTDMYPVSGDNVVCTITNGDGALFATPVTNPANVTTLSSIAMFAENNGRYTGNYVVVQNASEGDVTVQCIDLDTSPSLIVDAEIMINNLTMDAWANHDELVTRNQTQVAAGTNIVQNAATLFARVNDENGDPVDTIPGVNHLVTASITDGADANAFLLSNTSGADNNQVDADQLMDADGNFIPGYYTVQFVAGTSEGSVTVTFMDSGAVGSLPSADVNLDIYNPVIDVYKSADRVGLFGSMADGSTLIAKVVDNDDVPLYDETVCVKITSDAGTGSVLASGLGAGTCTGAGAVQMEPLQDITLTQTGFYIAQYFGPTYISKNDSTDIQYYNNVDRTGIDTETDTIDVQKSSSPNQIVKDLELLPIETVIGPNQVVPTLILVQDDEGYGVLWAADGAFDCSPLPGGGDPELYITALQNGAVDPIIEIADGAWGAENGLGYGAYQTAFVADPVAGTKGEIQVTDACTTAVQARQRFDIVDTTITLELLRDDVVTDEGFGALIYVYDHNDDPVTGLAGVTNINPPSGGNVAVNPSGVEELFQAGSSIANVGAYGPGSGVYIFSLDTADDINAGSYSVTVSTVNGKKVEDTDKFNVTRPQVDVQCHPDFAVTNNTISCTVVVEDEDGDPLVVPDDFLRVTTSTGSVLDGNFLATGGAKVDTLTNLVAAHPNGDGVYIFTFQGGNIEDSAVVTAQLWSAAVAVTPPSGPKLLDSESIDVDIR